MALFAWDRRASFAMAVWTWHYSLLHHEAISLDMDRPPSAIAVWACLWLCATFCACAMACFALFSRLYVEVFDSAIHYVSHRSVNAYLDVPAIFWAIEITFAAAVTATKGIAKAAMATKHASEVRIALEMVAKKAEWIEPSASTKAASAHVD